MKEITDKLYFYCKFGGVMPKCSDCQRNHSNSGLKANEIDTWYSPMFKGTKQCSDYIKLGEETQIEMKEITQEQRELLLKDLCARLPYSTLVWVHGFNLQEKLRTKHIDAILSGYDIKPYLRHMSSMTEEEKEEYRKACELDTEILSKHPMDETPFPALYNSQDWLNKHQFDYRGLIPLELALEAPKDMYNIKQE